KQFNIIDIDTPAINSVILQPTVSLNQFNPITVNAFDSTGVARVKATILTPNHTMFVLELKQTGFDQNSDWSAAFTGTSETGNYRALIRAFDSYWPGSSLKILEFTVTASPTECTGKNILAVAADNSFTTDYNNEFNWIEQYTANNDCMQFWKKSLYNSPDLNYLQKFNTVIWATENRFGESVDENDSQLLISYVNAGGRLLLEGSDIASEHLADELMQQTAHALWESEPGPDANANIIEFSQDSFLKAIAAIQFDSSKATFFDTLEDINTGKTLAFINQQPVMTYSQDYNTKSKTIFSSIAFNALNETDRTQLLNSSIEWLLTAPDTPPTVQIYSPNQTVYSKGTPGYMLFNVHDSENKQPLTANIYLDQDTIAGNGNEQTITQDLNLFNGFICWGYDFNTGKNCGYGRNNSTQTIPDGQYHYLITVNDGTNEAIGYSNYPIIIDSTPPTTTINTNNSTLTFTCNDGNGSGCQKMSYRAFAEKNIADPTMLGYWKLDEDPNNTMQDYSGKGNNGTVHSNSYKYYVTSAAANGKALYFNGTTFIEMPALEPKNKTITAWIYPFSYYTGSQTIAGTTNTTNNAGYYLGTANRAINATAFDMAGNSVTASTPLVFLRQQVTMVHDADNNKLALFINGEKKAETTINGYMPANNSFYLGTNAAGSQRFRGYMDEAALYGRALSATEIKEMYEKEKNGFWSNAYLNGNNSIGINLSTVADYNAGYYSYDKTGNKETEKSAIVSIR
ncbi:MAG: LamG domain-containing protein, partial [Candidatus Diapherotrites archaeon]|nr:LamG domain-containing protein [Candidatus Diapherotrites archaeon]